MIFARKYIIAAEVLALGFALAGAYSFGHRTATTAAERDTAIAVSKQKTADVVELGLQLSIAATNASQAQNEAIARAQAIERVRIEYVPIIKEISTYENSHPVNHACDLDAVGLRLWREANAGHAASAADQH